MNNEEFNTLLHSFKVTDDTTLAEIYNFYDALYGDLSYIAKSYKTRLQYHKEFILQIQLLNVKRQYLSSKCLHVKRRGRDGYYDTNIDFNVALDELSRMSEDEAQAFFIPIKVEDLLKMSTSEMEKHPLMMYVTQSGSFYKDAFQRRGRPYHGTDNKQKLKGFYIRKKAKAGRYLEYDNEALATMDTGKLMNHPIWNEVNSVGGFGKDNNKEHLTKHKRKNASKA